MTEIRKSSSLSRLMRTRFIMKLMSRTKEITMPLSIQRMKVNLMTATTLRTYVPHLKNSSFTPQISDSLATLSRQVLSSLTVKLQRKSELKRLLKRTKW